MKKVSILSLHFGYGGIEKSIAALANILIQKYDVEIVCIYKLQEEEAFLLDKKVKIKYLINSNLAKKVEKYKLLLYKGHFIKLSKLLWNDYFKKGKFISFFKDSFNSITMYSKRKKAMIKYLENCDSDYIISTRDFLNDLLAEYGNKDAIKIGWEHNHYHGDMKYADTVIRSVKKLDYFVLVSNSLYEFYKEKLKNYRCKCCFIPNVLEEIPKNVSSLNEKRLISVGRLAKEKGYLDLLRVYSLVKKDYPDWKLDIIGDGAEKDNLVEYIRMHHLENEVTLHGFRDKKYIDKYLNESSIYIMTSYTESFGIVLLEAMSHGLPCIAYDSAEGAIELISSGENGYLIKNRNIEAMVKKIEDLIKDKEKRIKIGLEARKSVFRYTSKVVGKEWFNLLEKSDKDE